MESTTETIGVMKWRGVLANANHTLRVVLAAVFSVACVALVSTRLGFVEFTLPDETVAHIALFLLPVSLGALLLGTFSGFALGLFAGVALYAHALLLPLDYFELAFVTPVTSIVLTTAAGFVLGVLFAALLRSGPEKPKRYLLIALACIVASSLYSGAFAFFTYDELMASSTSSGVTTVLGRAGAKVLVDAALMIVLCILADWAAARSHGLSDEVGMRAVFGTWLTAAVVIAFMVSGIFSYATITINELDKAKRDIRSEVDYLCYQLGRDVRASDADLVTGYTTDITGTVVIAHGDEIVASDDSRFATGTRLGEILDAELLAAIDASLVTGELQSVLYESPQGDTDGTLLVLEDPQIAYLLAGSTDEDLIFIVQPASVAYAERPAALGTAVLTSALLLLAVFLVVNRLLSNVVARRIDETNEALARITAGELDTKVQAGGTREFKSLSSGINETVDALKGWIAEAETRMESELAAAKAIQESALPREFPPFPDIGRFDLYANMNAAREVGGDFYDFFLIGDSDENGGKLAFVVADVSGKGVPAALFMMEAKAQIRGHLTSGEDLGSAVAGANDELCEGNDEGMFVTAWIGVLDYASGHVEYVNAGHNPPLALRQGSWQWLTERSGLPLGLFGGMPYETHSLDCEQSDKFVLYSDGVTEAMSVEGELYGEPRLESLLQGHAHLHPRDLVDATRADVAAHAEGAEQSDDITILALEV